MLRHRKKRRACHEAVVAWEVVAFSREAAETYALLTMEYPNRKANFDRLIAAHAIALEVPLVSNNCADFILYESSGLHLENWIESNSPS